MDTNAYTVLKLSVVGILVNTLMASGLSATENVNMWITQKPLKCNETILQFEMEACGDEFKKRMMDMEPHNWCNLTHFIRDYNGFSICTELGATIIGCYWPNPLVESYIIHIHKLFFSNCTTEYTTWADPPDNMLATLILIPVFLTLAMTALVMWCSRRSDILA